MSIIRIGSNKQYADGWESIFGGVRRGGSASTRAKTSKAGAAKTVKTAKAPAKAAKRTAKKKKKSTGR
jgi:hypothetical protein